MPIPKPERQEEEEGYIIRRWKKDSEEGTREWKREESEAQCSTTSYTIQVTAKAEAAQEVACGKGQTKTNRKVLARSRPRLET